MRIKNIHKELDTTLARRERSFFYSIVYAHNILFLFTTLFITLAFLSISFPILLFAYIYICFRLTIKYIIISVLFESNGKKNPHKTFI